MTGEMKRRKNGRHLVRYVSHGGKYLEAEALCGWKYPVKSTTKVDEVTCPACLMLISLSKESNDIKEATNAD